MNKEFEGKVALVTGGGSGIGRATALAFARDGAKVVIGNRNSQRGQETVAMIEKAGGTASFKQTDVLIAAQIEALVEHAVKTYGGLDFAFNNAGIEGEIKPTLVDHTESSYDAIMDINVKGVWLSMKYEIPADVGARRWRDCELFIRRGIDRLPRNFNLCCLETCGCRPNENGRVGIFVERDSHQRGQSCGHRHGNGRSD